MWEWQQAARKQKHLPGKSERIMESQNHRPVQFYNHTDSGNFGYLRSETGYFADRGTSIFIGKGAERISEKGKHGHSGGERGNPRLQESGLHPCQF